jgi:hypothetical protein
MNSVSRPRSVDLKRFRLSPHRCRGERRFTKAILAESANPKTSSSRLAAIEDGIRQFRVEHYRHPARYREIQRNIVAHPNVPLDMLFPNSQAIDDRLLAEYPDAFLSNPIVPLLALERPDYLQRLNKSTILRLLARANAPESFVALASSYADERIRDAAIHHVRKAGEFDTDGDAWENARRDFITKLPLPQAWNDRFQDNYEALWGLAEISPERDWFAEHLKERIGLPWWRCRRDNKSRWKLRQQAEDLSTPLVRLRPFKFVRDPGVLTAVYHNPNTPPDTRTEVHKQLVELVTQYSVYVPDRLMEPTLLDFLYDMQVRLIHDTREMTEGNRLLFQLIKEINPLDLPFPATRLARALNPTIPRRDLAILATREGHRIVRTAAQKALGDRSDEDRRN